MSALAPPRPRLVALALLALLAAAAPAQAERRRVAVPFDRADPAAGTLRLAVVRTPARQRRRGTIVALAGGPGESATALHRSTLDELGPRVRRSFDVVSFDARGTGLSGAVRCPLLQRDARTRSTEGAADCARRLGARRGAYVVGEQVEDLEAVRRALGVPRLDLIGTSYGTRVAQLYALRHPTRVGRLLLDSVVRPEGSTATGQEILRALPRVLGSVCGAARCGRYTPDPVAELGALVAQLRDGGPVRGPVPDRRGRPRPEVVDRVALLDLLLEGDFSPALREALPAAVAGARRGDPAPLLRLHRLAIDAVKPPPLRAFSVGAYAADSCESLDLPWDPAADRPTRLAQAADRLRSEGPAAVGPFDVETLLAADFLPLCLGWPAPVRPRPPEAATPAPLPDVPVLVLAGGEDLRTPVEDARAVAARARRGRLLVVPRSGHAVVGSDATGCARRAARAFLARSGRVPRSCPTLRSGRPVPLAPRSVGELPGRDAAARTLRALDLTFDDLAVVLSLGPLRGGGLRGGSFDASRFERLVLRRYEYVAGVRVDAAPGPGGALRVRIRGGAGAASGRVVVSERGAVRGRLGGRRVRAQLRGGPPRA